jgi:hypothetical protein
VCGDHLALTRLSCERCASEITGSFPACEFCSLTEQERELLRVFLVSRGNMKELERSLGVSYPTARARFDSLLTSLGLASPSRAQLDRVEVLRQLARAEITLEEADELTRPPTDGGSPS